MHESFLGGRPRVQWFETVFLTTNLVATAKRSSTAPVRINQLEFVQYNNNLVLNQVQLENDRSGRFLTLLLFFFSLLQTILRSYYISISISVKKEICFHQRARRVPCPFFIKKSFLCHILLRLVTCKFLFTTIFSKEQVWKFFLIVQINMNFATTEKQVTLSSFWWCDKAQLFFPLEQLFAT